MKLSVKFDDISYGTTISNQYRNYICSNGYNFSPKVSWEVSDVDEDWIESYSIFAYCEDYSTVVDYSETDGCFCIWGVRNIPTNIKSLNKNGSWPDGVEILKTDFNNGDRSNGWNGPGLCGDTKIHKYSLVVIAKLKNNKAHLESIFGEDIPEDLLFYSSEYEFIDNPANITSAFSSSSCNKYICPNGYDSETEDGLCLNSDNNETAEKVLMPCYVTIQNNLDASRLNIVIDETLEIGYCYSFKASGVPEFYSKETGNLAAFTIIQNHVNSSIPRDAIYLDDVEITKLENCNLDNHYLFESCDGTKKVITTLMADSIHPSLGYIYNMSFCTEEGEFSYYEFETVEFTETMFEECECYVYKGLTDEELTHHSLSIYNDYHSDMCTVCLGCLRFKACDNDENIIVSLLYTEDNPDNEDLGKIFFLNGYEEIEDRGWRFMGYERCDINVGYKNVVIYTKLECDNCNSLNPYYKATNCLDKDDVIYIWTQRGFNLSEDKTYVFDFLPDNCYTVKLQKVTCSDRKEGEYFIKEENVRESYDTCEKCNEQAYLIKDCESEDVFKPTNQDDVEPYVGKYVKYSLTDETAIRCGQVIKYRQGRYDYQENFVKLLLGCYTSCQECSETVTTEKSVCVKGQREVEPHRENIECCNTPKRCVRKIKKCYGSVRVLR